MQPKINKIWMSSGCSINIVTFSIEGMILHIVNNKYLFTPNKLFLNVIDPCSDPPELSRYGEVNPGTCFIQVKQKDCHLPNHMLMNFCHSIDGLSVDNYIKLIVDTMLTCRL